VKLLLEQWRKYLISEAKFDRETTELSRAIIKLFKANAGPMEDFSVNVPVPDSLSSQLDDIIVEFIFTRDMPSRIEGEYGDRYMKFVVEIDPQEDPNATISSWLGNLKGTIRHELEHVLQDARGEFGDDEGTDFEDVESFLDYYFDPVEIEAFAAEIYKRAKTEKKPVTVFINDRMDKFVEEAEDFVFLDELSREDLERHEKNIRSEIEKNIKERYPGAQFSESWERYLKEGS